MKNLDAFLAEKGFKMAAGYDCDGAWHRFPRGDSEKPNARFQGTFQDTPSGKFLYVRLWDWKTGEDYMQAFPDPGVTKTDLDTGVKELRSRQDAEDTAESLEVARIVQDVWDRAGKVASITPYMTKKGLTEFFGARNHPNNTRDLLVPLRDISGKLWSFQTIHPDGGKPFWPGGKIRGCYHLIGAPLSPKVKKVFICEGYATGASLYMATGVRVVCAMSAHQLTNVAKEIRAAYPALDILIAGDDDCHTPGNPGKTCAQKAARAVGGKFWLPKFKAGCDGTDANDLHLAYGLEELQRQLSSPENLQTPPVGSVVVSDTVEETLPPGHPASRAPHSADAEGQGAGVGVGYVIPLGYAGDKYYFTSSGNPQVSCFGELSKTELYKLMPHEWWFENHGHLTGGKTPKKVLDWDRVKSDLMRNCREQGGFEIERIRGSGVWMDQGRVVLHLGDRLFYDGQSHSLRSLSQSVHTYAYGKKLPPVHGEPLAGVELKPFHDLLSELNYAQPEQKMFLGGWLALANICGILQWRPHIWVTGEQGTGKSTVVESIVKPITGAFSQLHVQGATTEAGIRQRLKSCAIPVLFDEFEAASKNAAGRVESVVELFRQASSDTGGAITKGSATGEAQDFHTRFAGCVASIGTNLVTSADKSRFTLVELKKIHGNPEQWARVQALVAQFTPDFCQRFFARMVKLAPVILENQRKLQAAFAAKHSQRFGQQYGTLLAGWAACVSDGVLSQGEVETLVAQVHLDKEISSNQTPDQEECLQHLLHKQHRVGDETTTLSDILRAQNLAKADWGLLNNQHWKDDPIWKAVKPRLARLGVVPTLSKEGKKKGFVVMASHPELRALFKETGWGHNWSQALGRLAGAEANIQVRDTESKRVRGTWLPMSSVGGESDPIDPGY